MNIRKGSADAILREDNDGATAGTSSMNSEFGEHSVVGVKVELWAKEAVLGIT
jgi:hypothetical protein